MKRLAIAIAAIALIGTQVLAANLHKPVYKAPPPAPPPAPRWTGWYVGINGGGVWGSNDPSLVVLNTHAPDGYFYPLNGAAVAAAGSQSFNNSGGLFGGQIGYLAEWGSVIAGLEAGMDWMGINGSQTISQLYPLQKCVQAAGCAFTINQSVKSDWLFTFLGRVGWDMGVWYPYVTGGLAVSNLKYNFGFIDNNGGFNFNTALSISDTKAGGAIGGGVEWRFSPNWMLRAEYLYVQFDGLSGTTPPITSLTFLGGLPLTQYVISSGTFKENIGRAALSYKF
jgi:outer membrane immunogenic protein